MKKLVLLFLLISTVFSAQNKEELFANANALYKEGKYQEAITIYEQLESKNLVSSELYHNLGNCYYKINKVAPTIYNYEKALQLAPTNEDARNNLIFAKRLTLDRIEALPLSIFQKANNTYLKKLHFNTWAVIAVLSSVFVALFFISFYFAYTPSKKRLFFVVSILSLIILLSSFTIAYTQYQTSKNTQEAIIYATEVAVQNEPTNNSVEAFILHEGTKVVILDTVDDWKKIKLADGKIGWLLTKNLKQL